jgi:hypothetical protein
VNRELFARATARGEPAPAADPDLVFDILNGLAMTTAGAASGPRHEFVLRRLLDRTARGAQMQTPAPPKGNPA